jgi:hypothetical protein
MKNPISFATLGLTLALTACVVSQPAEPVTRAAWHLQTSGHTRRAPAADSLMHDALERTPAAPQERRMRVISTAYRTGAPSAVTAAPALAVITSGANAHELAKADSLLTVLTVQNRAADALQHGQAGRAEQRQSRRKREKRPAGFNFKATNIKPADTIFVNRPGLKFAAWLGPKGVELKVAEGVLNKQRSPDGVDASVRPGYDWQPYRAALLIVGTAAAVSIMLGLGVALGTGLKPLAS